MSEKDFSTLKVGDYVIHGFGHVGRIISIDEGGYVARDPSFDPKDKKHWDVYFAWNEGSIVPDYHGKEIPMSLREPIRKSYFFQNLLPK